MAGWVLPAASLLGAIYAGSRGDGGGSEFSPQQERLFDTQADIAEMMKGLYESRIANEEQYLGDAMSRVFQYADRMQNRSPDLLNAPGIFEFMPKGRQREGQAPEWQPFTPEAGKPTEVPPPENPILQDQGLRDLEDLNPVTDVVPRIDMNVLAALLPRIFAQMGAGPEGLEDALGLDGKTDTDWDAWLKDMPKTLTQIEDMMRDTLGVDQKRGEAAEALYNPWARTYNDNAWRTPGAIEIDSADLAPPGELNPGSGVRIDGTTGEILGESFPMPDIDVDQFLSALQAEAGSGVSDFTGMMPGVQEEQAWRTRRREEQDDAAIEAGDYIEITPEQVGNLQEYSSGPGGFTFDVVERDGKYYLADAVSSSTKSGWFDDKTSSSDLSIDQIEKMLSGEYDAKAMQEEVWNRRNPRTRTAPTGTRRT